MTTKNEQTFTLSSDYFGQRLDHVLSELLPEYSRSRIQAWLLGGEIKINGKITKPKTKVLGNEIVTLTLSEPTNEGSWEAEAIPLDILHEDESLLIVNKPAGLVTHPGAGNSSGTLVNALLYHSQKLASLPRAGLVHRLDKDTSGLLVVAKTLPAHTELVRQMQARQIKREYLAVVNGQPKGQGTIEGAIGRHPVQREKMALHPLGKPAITHYRVLEFFRHHALVKVTLETGRTHQIRVHMASIHHPVTGDPVYGQLRLPPKCHETLKETLRQFDRQALHARKLSLTHPLSQKVYSWHAPVPQDMTNLIMALKQDAHSHDDTAIDDFDFDEDWYDDEEL